MPCQLLVKDNFQCKDLYLQFRDGLSTFRLHVSQFLFCTKYDAQCFASCIYDFLHVVWFSSSIYKDLVFNYAHSVGFISSLQYLYYACFTFEE